MPDQQPDQEHPDREPAATRVSRLAGALASVVAPASMLSALLFYFGYVSSRAQYEYFGIDVDTIGLGTQDYIMRSPQPLLVPLLVLTLAGAGLLVLHTEVRRRTRRAAGGRSRTIRLATRTVVIIGLAILGAGMALVFAYPAVQDWPAYGIATPLLITTGGALVSYAWRFAEYLSTLHPPARGTGSRKAAPATADDPALLRRTARVLIYALVAVNIFWATATVAQWSGRGLARDVALHLDRLPRVILDTREQMFLRSPGIEETILPASDGQTFHYRYRGLRLLIVGRDRMFLVPEKWSASNSTLVVPINDSVRIQFQFQNQRPK